MNTSSTNSGSIRIVELPSCRMVSSAGRNLDEFNAWWSEEDRHRTDRFYPRDFMYFDRTKKELVWLYAAPADVEPPRYSVVDFPGGLYAVSPCIDGDDVDGERVYGEICHWIDETAYFSRDESSERPHLFHVITSDAAFEKLGYRQLDIYVPVK
jgi:hypothetical protein